ncbi:unnamed protein product [Phytomonas sp. EM1]|nr:unnamed protein product [Phytomonas sp. EM1]|eukprot:CCW62551.1 unnamed protein product [Phytomonas sp. isolate EM1]
MARGPGAFRNSLLLQAPRRINTASSSFLRGHYPIIQGSQTASELTVAARISELQLNPQKRWYSTSSIAITPIRRNPLREESHFLPSKINLPSFSTASSTNTSGTKSKKENKSGKPGEFSSILGKTSIMESGAGAPTKQGSSSPRKRGRSRVTKGKVSDKSETTSARGTNRSATNSNDTDEAKPHSPGDGNEDFAFTEAIDDVFQLHDSPVANSQKEGLGHDGKKGEESTSGESSSSSDLKGADFPSNGFPNPGADPLDFLTPSLEMDVNGMGYGSGFEKAPSNAASNPEMEGVLSAVDMLCDDLYYCKTEVLRSYARTRSITGRTKAELVLRIIEAANRAAHGESEDLSLTKRLLGDVFSEEIRTSGLRSAWTNKSLEASHVELACDRHLSFEMMVNSNKTLMARRNSTDAMRVLRKLSRSFQQDYETLSMTAVGGVFRTYKAEADQLVNGLSLTEVVSPFAVYLVSYVRFATSRNLFMSTDVNEQLVQLEVVQPSVEEGDGQTLQRMMGLLDDVVATVERRRGCYGDRVISWGQETNEVLVSDAQAFSEMDHGKWNTELAPAWVHDLARMFNNWEAILRTDVPIFADVPRYFFDCLLNGVVCYYVLKKIYGDHITSTDMPLGIRRSLKTALQRHFKDPEKAFMAIHELLTYVQVDGCVTATRGIKGSFFSSVLSQMQGTFSNSEQGVLQNERVAVILNEVCMTASRCTRSCGLFNLLVKITEDLQFHFRFQAIFKLLNANDRKTIRTKPFINMIQTLEYFEKEYNMTPISTKAVGFLVIQLLYISMCSGVDGRAPVVERFKSTLDREELDIIGLTDLAVTQVRDLHIAFPPQLSYNSWLNESDTKEKSVYNVLPSVAVKGSTNQAMLISQAPMMQALDAISRVPWRISKYMLHVQEAIVREGFGFGKIRAGFYPLHYCALSRGDMHYPSKRSLSDGSAADNLNDDENEEDDNKTEVYNILQRRQYNLQQNKDWRELSEMRSNRIHYLQALRQARSLVQFSHIYFPNSMDFRGRMYPLPGRLNHTGSDPFRGLLEYAEPKPLGKTGLYWLKVHLANKMGMSKLSFDERVHYVDEHIEDVVQSAESPLRGDRWWQEASEPLQCLMACKDLADALKCSQGPENFLSRVPVAVDGSYNGLQHYSAIGRDAFGAKLVNLVPSPRPADAYTGILKEMLKSIEADAARDHQVAQRCLGSGKGQDMNHIRRKTIKRPIMTQVYGVTGYGMSEQILGELVKQNRSHGLWTNTDMREMAAYLREKVLESLGVTFRETQNCRRWLREVTELIWSAQPAELRNELCWTTPLGLVVRQPYKLRKEAPLFTFHGFTRIPGDAVAPASRKQLTAIAPNLIHSLDATHLAMTALEMQRLGLSMMAVHDSYWTYACDLPQLSKTLREQFVLLYGRYDPLWELKGQWEEAYFMDLRRHGIKLPDPPPRGDLDLNVVLDSPYFFS